MKKSLLLMSLLFLACICALAKVEAQATPTIKVEPALNVRSPFAVWPNYVNKTFTVDITLNTVDSEHRLVAADFFLTYNKTLLRVLSISEGPWFKDSRWNLAGTLFISFVEVLPDGTGIIKAMNLIYPNLETGNYNDWTDFPNGNGVVAMITFEAIYEPVAPQSSESCALRLTDGMLRNYENAEITCNFQDASYQVQPLQLPRTPIGVNIDVGSIHFGGEMAEFYVLITDYGKAIETTSLKANMYHNGQFYADLTGNAAFVSPGLYRILYNIPANIEVGTYTLLVEAEFFEAQGSNIKTFLISSSLQQVNTVVQEINGELATVLLPDMNSVKLNLTAINAELIGLHGNTAIINSTLGIIETDIANLNPTITKMDGDVAAVSTRLGEIQTKLGETQSLATIATYLSIVLFIAVLVIFAFMLISRPRPLH